ncbi:hypothetical protein PFLUV_G00001220 [Perca fluviatilis]|uniref:C-type lectin domain-containing protein n=1 Tax=Perca fluviatilis TaxID=8168 RepID=A0A6A5FPI1_PERFL|nr:galactose-specific lectin nattectin-like [Perca fluviatilis]XP_039663873.1 galactose-specific lectin nattectin-like [Perca fluviatilis]XP_039663881.1 galactose-specific lectin nattectin-like [Perca fluviatilis]KAF1394525.1 hypothetical protein PFLUV_G00001220 [Perca fluviatilis]
MTSVFPFALLLCLSSGLLAAYGEPACPPGWTQFDTRCFAFYMQRKTWLDAETFCQTAGGHLASIYSAEENTFLQDFIFQVTGAHTTSWIGGTDTDKVGTWMWSDGSRLKYKSWAAGEPNLPGVEDCLLMNWVGFTSWFDWVCTNQASFVCSKNSV